MPTPEAPDKQTFYVGLCMAGAVSAGAYTAGVMDYLIEALDNWQQQKGNPGIPDHQVKIPVIGGASAGGMTGILTASAINHSIPPIHTIEETHLFAQNKFWHTWVDLLADDMFPLLLNTSDITPANILSLLNSSFIDSIASRIVAADPTPWMSRPYFEDKLKVFTTLSSLKGLSFDIQFLGSGTNPDKYCVNRHNDFACFKLNSTEYEDDGWIPLDFKTGLSATLASEAAMATGAFPVGLRARRLVREKKYMNDNPFLKSITTLNPVEGDMYEALNVDGGLINNEPFEKVRDVLISVTGQTDAAQYNNYNSFSSTVLMIDPFPSEPPVYHDSDRLRHVIGSTLSVLVNQARVKQENLVDAVNSHMAGQYLIAPSRKVPQPDGQRKEEMGAKAIACGALGGFSGFLHREFRIHDYFLGRANCEKFLRDHFTVPADSTNLITAGYQKLTESERERFYSATHLTKHVPIIPVLQPRGKKYMPIFPSGSDWPVREEADIERFRSKTKDRVNALIMNLAEYGTVTKVLLRIGGFVLLNRKIAGVAIDAIKDSLREHRLMGEK